MQVSFNQICFNIYKNHNPYNSSMAKEKTKAKGSDAEICHDEQDNISDDWDQDEMELAFKKSR